MLQVARALATVEEENASEERSVAREPLHSRCVRFVVVGLTAVSQSQTEAAALQQAKKQQRSGGGGGKITRLCPPVWLAENTERNKNSLRIKIKKAVRHQRCLDENRPNRAPLKR